MSYDYPSSWEVEHDSYGSSNYYGGGNYPYHPPYPGVPHGGNQMHGGSGQQHHNYGPNSHQQPMHGGGGQQQMPSHSGSAQHHIISGQHGPQQHMSGSAANGPHGGPQQQPMHGPHNQPSAQQNGANHHQHHPGAGHHPQRPPPPPGMAPFPHYPHATAPSGNNIVPPPPPHYMQQHYMHQQHPVPPVPPILQNQQHVNAPPPPVHPQHDGRRSDRAPNASLLLDQLVPQGASAGSQVMNLTHHLDEDEASEDTRHSYVPELQTHNYSPESPRRHSEVAAENARPEHPAVTTEHPRPAANPAPKASANAMPSSANNLEATAKPADLSASDARTTSTGQTAPDLRSDMLASPQPASQSSPQTNNTSYMSTPNLVEASSSGLPPHLRPVLTNRHNSMLEHLTNRTCQLDARQSPQLNRTAAPAAQNEAALASPPSVLSRSGGPLNASAGNGLSGPIGTGNGPVPNAFVPLNAATIPGTCHHNHHSHKAPLGGPPAPQYTVHRTPGQATVIVKTAHNAPPQPIVINKRRYSNGYIPNFNEDCCVLDEDGSTEEEDEEEITEQDSCQEQLKTTNSAAVHSAAVRPGVRYHGSACTNWSEAGLMGYAPKKNEMRAAGITANGLTELYVPKRPTPACEILSKKESAQTVPVFPEEVTWDMNGVHANDENASPDGDSNSSNIKSPYLDNGDDKKSRTSVMTDARSPTGCNLNDVNFNSFSNQEPVTADAAAQELPLGNENNLADVENAEQEPKGGDIDVENAQQDQSASFDGELQSSSVEETDSEEDSDFSSDESSEYSESDIETPAIFKKHKEMSAARLISPACLNMDVDQHNSSHDTTLNTPMMNSSPTTNEEETSGSQKVDSTVLCSPDTVHGDCFEDKVVLMESLETLQDCANLVSETRVADASLAQTSTVAKVLQPEKKRLGTSMTTDCSTSSGKSLNSYSGSDDASTMQQRMLKAREHEYSTPDDNYIDMTPEIRNYALGDAEICEDGYKYSGALRKFCKEQGHGFLRSRELQQQYGRDVYVRMIDLPRLGEACYIGQLFEFNVVFNANNKSGQMRARNVRPIENTMSMDITRNIRVASSKRRIQMMQKYGPNSDCIVVDSAESEGEDGRSRGDSNFSSNQPGGNQPGSGYNNTGNSQHYGPTDPLKGYNAHGIPNAVEAANKLAASGQIERDENGKPTVISIQNGLVENKNKHLVNGFLTGHDLIAAAEETATNAKPTPILSPNMDGSCSMKPNVDPAHGNRHSLTHHGAHGPGGHPAPHSAHVAGHGQTGHPTHPGHGNHANHHGVPTHHASGNPTLATGHPTHGGAYPHAAQHHVPDQCCESQSSFKASGAGLEIPPRPRLPQPLEAYYHGPRHQRSSMSTDQMTNGASNPMSRSDGQLTDTASRYYQSASMIQAMMPHHIPPYFGGDEELHAV